MRRRSMAWSRAWNATAATCGTWCMESWPARRLRNAAAMEQRNDRAQSVRNRLRPASLCTRKTTHFANRTWESLKCVTIAAWLVGHFCVEREFAWPCRRSIGACRVPCWRPAPALRPPRPRGAPLRMAFCYIPNGVNVASWTPRSDGTDYELSRTLQPLKEFRQDFQVITGLEQRNGFSGKDGAGDHARANSTILTGARPKKTAGADIHLGISVDQLAAQHLTEATRFPSLELSCDGVRKAGACDSGYSCAYQFNISWRTPTSPMSPESNPRLVFERFFGSGSGPERQQAFRCATAAAEVDSGFCRRGSRANEPSTGRNDRQKVDEYLTGVRDIERSHRTSRAVRRRARPGRRCTFRHSHQLSRTPTADDRHAGVGLPDRLDADRHLPDGS